MLIKISRWLEALNEERWMKLVIFLHLAFAFIIFSPFFLLGQNIIGSTDNLFGIFPNMLFNQDAFQRGDLGLWNPYVLGGIDFSASTHSFILYPINWIIFAFPQKYFFLLMTLRMFFEVWLVGVVGYLFFKEELGNKKWALFSSTAYQLCGYTFFSITTYANLTIYLFITLALYVIWTLEKRNRYLSYIYLVSCVATFFLSGNILYGITATLMVTILFMYKHWPLSINPFSRNSSLFYISVATGMLVSMARIIPIFNEILFQGARIGDVLHLGSAQGYIYLGSLTFVPEIMGVNLGTSLPIIEAVTLLKGCHAQFHGYNYFGALSMILLFWAAIKVRNKKIFFWGTYLFIASATLLLIQPVSDIVYLILSPCIHTIVPKMMIPVAFCTIIGYAGMSIETESQKIKKNEILGMCALIAIAACSVFLVWGLFQPDILLRPLKTMISAIGILVMIAVYLFRRRSKGINKVLFGIVLAGISLVFIWYLQKFIYVFPDTRFLTVIKNKFFLFCFVNVIVTILVLSSILVLLLNSWGNFLSLKKEKFILGTAALLFFMLCLNPFWGSQEIIAGVPVIASLGVIRFLLVGLIFLLAVNSGKGSKVIFVLFYLILIADLLAFNKMYTNQVMPPFFKGSTLYPQRKLAIDPDAYQNYRLNSANVLLQTPGTETNIFEVYRVRSYGGVNSSVFKRSSDFVHNYLPLALAGSGIYPNLNDERYLDLMGCRYDADDKGGLVIRPNAVSRFMFFKDFEVISDDGKMLDRLKAQDFKPNKQVVLESDPQTPSFNAPAKELGYTSLKTSELVLNVTSDVPGVVFFDDTYHEGWKAYVNGAQKPVIRADYNFMAVAVPAGTNKVVFRFHPKLFFYSLDITFGGLLIFVLIIFILYHNRKKDELARGGYKFNLWVHLRTYQYIYLLIVGLIIVMVMRTNTVRNTVIPQNVSVSSSHFPEYVPSNLFYDVGVWHAQTPPKYPEWVEMAFIKPTHVDGLAIQSQADSVNGSEHIRSPRDFVFQASNDRHSWVKLLDVKHSRYFTGSQWKRWSFRNNASYTYYRLYITANNGDANLLTIQQIKLEQ